MTDASQQFSEYLRQKNQVKTTPQQTNFAPTPYGMGGVGKAGDSERGFLGTVSDFLMSGVYAMTTPLNSLLDIPERVDNIKAKAEEGDVGGAVSDTFKGLGWLASANVRGLTVTPRRTAGLDLFEGEGEAYDYSIEKAVDVANRNNPNYVDVDDNVDPTFKAGAGLALDILGDPLTWVGGAALSAPKIFSRSAGTASKTADDILERSNLITPTQAAERSRAGTDSPSFLSKAEELAKDTPTSARVAPETKGPDVFPSSSVTKQIEETVESAPLGGKTVDDGVNEVLQKTISGKMVDLPGVGMTTARSGLKNFFDFLKKPKTTSTSPIITKFGSFVNQVKKDATEGGASVRIEQVIPNYTPAPITGASTNIAPTLEGAIQQYDQVSKLNTSAARAIREAIEQRVLMPLQAKYNSAVRAGHSINTLGVAKTAKAEAEVLESQGVADIVMRNLGILDAGNKARGEALLGKDFFARVSAMNSSQMAKVLDELEIILQSTGTSKDIRPLLGSETGSELLKIFDINEAAYTAAKADVEKRLLDAKQGVVKPNLEETLSTIDENPAVLSDISDNLSLFGMNGDRFAFLRGSPANSGKVFDIVQENLAVGSNASKRNFSDARRKEEGITYVTENGNFTSAEIFGEGYGVRPNMLNSEGQMNFIVAAAINMNKYFDPKTGVPFLKDLNGFQKASAKEAMMLATIKTYENAMEVKGIPFVMDLKVARDTAAVSRSLKFSQVYETLATGPAQRAMRIATFKAGTGVSYTKIMDAVMTGIVGSDRMNPAQLREEILTVLRSTETVYKKSAPNWFATPQATAQVGKAKYNSGKLSEQVADSIIESLPALKNQAEVNTITRRARGVAEGEELSAEASNILLKMLNDPVKIAQSGITVAKSGRLLGDVANTVGNVSDLGGALGNLRLSLGLGENFKMSAETTVALANKVASRKAPAVGKAQRESYEQAEKVYEDVQKTGVEALEDIFNGRARITNPNNQKLVDDVAGDVMDRSVNPANAIAAGALGRARTAYVKAFDFLNRTFNVNRGMGAENNMYVKQLFDGAENIQEKLALKLLIPLNQIGQKLEYKGFVDTGKTTTVIQEAYNAMREGRKAAGAAGKAQEELTPLFARFFNLDGNPENSLMGNLLVRQGTSLERVNEILSRRKVLETTSGKIAKAPDEYYDLGKIAEELGPNAKPEDVMNALSEQWKTWDVQDPILFLDRYTRAVSQAVGESTYVTGFVSQSAKFNLLSTKPKDGFVRLGAGDGPTLLKHLQEDVWVHPDVAESFVRSSEFLDEISNLGNSAVERAIDEFTDAFKYAATQARLGHHLRNFVGAATMTGMAQGAKYYRPAGIEAFRVRALVETEDVTDIVKVFEHYGEPVRTTVSNKPSASVVAHNGAKGAVTRGELAEAISRYGVNPEVRTAEAFDQLGSGQSIAGKTTQKFLTGTSLGLAARGGQMEKMWTSVSRLQDHIGRDQMFIQYVMQALDGQKMTRSWGKTITFDWKKKDVMEDVFAAAAERVAKYHPTGRILTAAERRTGRRLFPFYAWNKGALIAMTEAVAMHPGRVNWPFKVNYAVASATGVDPNSMYDPFPSDQRFPSYMVEDLQGPQWVVNGKYYGLQPGFAQFDVFNQFAGPGVGLGVYEGLTNSLNPGIKLPIELATQSRLATRNPIADVSDYVDSSIPTVSYIANATTYSPSSLFIDGSFEQNAKYESGDKTDLSRIISLVNWFTGSSVREYSRPDAGRLAKIEENIRLSEERGN